MTLHIATCLRAFCCATIIAIGLANGFDARAGSWYAIGFLACIYAFTSRGLVRRQPLIIPFSLSLVFYFGLRLWDYYVLDTNNIISYFDVQNAVRSNAGDRAMGFLLGSSLAMYLGLLAPNVRALGQGLAEPASTFRPYRWPVQKNVFLVSYVLMFGLMIFFNVVDPARVRFGSSILFHTTPYLFNIQVLLIAATILYGGKPGADAVRWCVALCCMFAYLLAQGARSSTLEILQLILAWAIIPRNWSYTIPISFRTVLASAVVVAGSFTVFFVSNAIRTTYYDNMIRFNPLDLFSGSDDLLTFLTLVYRPVAYRIGENLDALVLVFSRDYDYVYANLHVNLYTMLMNSLQRLVHIPQSPYFTYPEFELGHIVGNPGNDVDGVLVPTGYTWGVFAYAWQIFGAWSFLALPCTMFGFGAAYLALAKRGPSLGRDMALFGLGYFLQVLVTLFGVDNLLAKCEQMMTTFLFVVLASKFLPRDVEDREMMVSEIPSAPSD